MSYFAVVVAQKNDRWSAHELDLGEIEDLDALAEQMREVADGGTALLFLEEDEEYLAVVRVDGDGEPRTFISDDRAVSTSALAELIMQDIAPPEVSDDDDEDEGIKPEPEAVGDIEIVASFGVSSDTLLALCAEERMLPADVMTAICEKAGCVDELDELRGT